ncbi:hypothetical protein [Aliarcobacter cryaerophilus]|uniref:Uncharacterized protein n=1 Tax=Aliarcobacter cryaerophilus TaxID=28198 RepID=A0A2S9TJ88_9BACT|nr:hypothetical protein [Aliarcobacter cryaerophilus]PRM98928.1 hypothetical protein CJ670_00935 [Arcobacter cryaerophilus gv. crypticus]
MFKVIKVIDDKTLVINAGFKKNIIDNYEFLVYEIGEELFDPDTNESLGKLEIIKGTAKPIHIQENMTIIKSNKYNTVEDKKIIKKSNQGLSLFSGTHIEEIIEPREKTIKPFDNPAIGDFVKILNKSIS